MHIHNNSERISHCYLRNRYRKQFCADGERNRDGNWDGDECASRYQLSGYVLGKFCERDAGYVDSISGGWLYVRWLDRRRMLRNRDLRGNGECGCNGEGYV